MVSRKQDSQIAESLVRIIADLMKGERHSRGSVAAKANRSKGTASRWLKEIHRLIPTVKTKRDGKTLWYSLPTTVRPSWTAAVGATIAAGFGPLFENSEHERNLRDARDYLLRCRGESYPELDRKFLFAAKGGEAALPEKAAVLDDIIGALLESRRVAFRYTHNDGREERCSVEPLSLVVYGHQFYLLARTAGSKPYPYRFARIDGVSSHAKFAYPGSLEYDPRRLLATAFGIHLRVDREPAKVVVRLRGAWASYAKSHRWHPTQTSHPKADGSVDVELTVVPCAEVETWVLSFGDAAEVIGPMELRERVSGRLRAAANLYPAVTQERRPAKLRKPSPGTPTRRTQPRKTG